MNASVSSASIVRRYSAVRLVAAAPQASLVPCHPKRHDARVPDEDHHLLEFDRHREGTERFF